MTVAAAAPESGDKATTANARLTADDATATVTTAASEAEHNLSSSAVAGTRRDIYAESSASQHDQHAIQDADSDATAAAVTLDEIAYQKLRGSKETMYTKLKNRIRTLEDNLNLTNR